MRKKKNRRRKRHKLWRLPEWEWLQDVVRLFKLGKDDEGREPSSITRRRTPPAVVDERISLDLEEIGRLGSYFFLTDSSNYLKRHVETLQIKSGSHARRRLTIDIQLPTDPTLGRRDQEGIYEFWMPVTYLAKFPSRSNVDVRDDQGRTVPLLTRSESNQISIAAALVAAEDEEVLGKKPSQFLEALFKELIKSDGMRGEMPMLLARQALRSEGANLDNERTRALVESLRTLSGNYSMWVGFHGRPGERRVVKFHYDVEFARQGILRQRPTTRGYLVFGKDTLAESEMDLEERGDKNPYSPLRRVLARITSSTGLGAVNVGIESPYLVGSDSYHLQVESPPGVETRDLDLLATVDEEEGDARSWSRDHGAHLYVSRARFTEESAGLALLTLRIGRRGFTTLAWISALVSATTLWLFDLTAKKHLESHEATAAVLLFGPALLAAMVVRPNEHPVTTKLFSGVRLLVALNGILVVAGAAAVAGVRPEGWTTEHTWFIFAIVASGGAAIVSLSWIFSWEVSYRLVKGLRRQLTEGARYRRLCAQLLGLAVAVLVLGPLIGSLSLPEEAMLAPLAAIVLVCGFVAGGYAGMERSSAGLAALSVALTGLALIAAGGIMVMDLASDWTWEVWWLGLSLVPLVGLLALWGNNVRWRWTRKKEGDPASAESDGSGLPRVLQQTPSGYLVRKQARKKATGIPDLIAPSAYREVSPPEELIDDEQARQIFVTFKAAWDIREGTDGAASTAPATGEGPEDGDLMKAVEDQAKADGREFVCVNL